MMASVESTCRNNTAEENLSLWKEIVSLTCRTLTSCSTILFTSVATLDPHHRVGSTYKAYPTYDFACPEYHDRNTQYYHILQFMGLQRVEIFQFSRLNMVYTLLSKHKLLWFVQNHKVDDWTAPFYNS
ncbi:hypothetical protein ACJX0J_015877, partial [Zea mays]